MKAFAGALINPKSFGDVEFVNYGLVFVDSGTGKIIEIKKFQSKEALEDGLCKLSPECQLTRLSADQFICPGLIDMHTHAPQYRNLGLGLDYPLLEWLDKVTFPEERSYNHQLEESSEQHRSRVAKIYGPMVQHYLRCGTTTCCYFGGLQMEANEILVEQVALGGQRALIGKTCMDCNSPPDYVETTEESVRDTKRFIEFVKNCDRSLCIPGRILPVVTPRFALTCTPNSMKGLADLAISENLHVQTHMSENSEEVQVAKSMFPESKNYAAVYSSMGLLTTKTFLAHCVHMDDGQREILATHGTSVSHCPTSNFALNSGTANIRALLSAGIKVGLGTDVSGGYGLSILDAMRQAIITSKALHFQDCNVKPLTVKEAFFLATLGGAEALGLDNIIGSFQAGKAFDALLVDMTKCPSVRHPEESLDQSLQRFVFLGDDRWISHVYVNGIVTE